MCDPSTSNGPRRALRLGIAQMHPRVADVQHNLALLEGFVERAVAADVDLLVTPELALTGYPVRSWFSSASIGPSSPELAQGILRRKGRRSKGLRNANRRGGDKPRSPRAEYSLPADGAPQVSFGQPSEPDPARAGDEVEQAEQGPAEDTDAD